MARLRYTPKPVISILIAMGALVFAYILANVDAVRLLELDFLDYRFRLRGALDVSESPIVILAVDDQSDESTPERWPWPRWYFAHVIENLEEAGVRVIGIDVIFDQVDRHGRESDALLAETLRTYDNIILSGKLHKTMGRLESTILVPPETTFRSSGVSWGLVSGEVDGDGIFRRYLISQDHMDSTYVSFAVEVLNHYQGYSNRSIVDDGESYRIGDSTIPKYDAYSMLINFVGPAYTFPVYSFDNVLDDVDFQLAGGYDVDAFDDPGDIELGLPPGLLQSGVFKDKIVLIGSTMQELHDDFPTPFLDSMERTGRRRSLMPGVEVHANALRTILDQDYILTLGFWGHLGIVVLLGLLVTLASYKMRTVWGAICIVGFGLAYIVLSSIVFNRLNLILEMTTPLLFIACLYVGHHLYRYVLSQNEKRMIQGAFSHYVPERVVAEILDDPEKLKLGGEERIVTVMFSDIADFTTISENMAPSELVVLLNDYLTEMSEIVLTNDGIIDKYEGDAIMAEFGIPVADDAHAAKACRAALEMQHRLDILNDGWVEMGRPVLNTRIGINTGEVISGNMGSRNVFDYTVIGDAVNLGSRLEGANKVYGTRILVSEFTHRYIKDAFHTRLLDTIRVKGKKEPVSVYELVAQIDEALDDRYREMLTLFQEGLNLYRNHAWDDALVRFQNCLKLQGKDGPSLIYKGRCLIFKKTPPPEDWDGVTVFNEK